MIKKVIELKRQSADWRIIETHSFLNRNYQIDEFGNFYRNGIEIKVKPDRVNSFTHNLTDDNGLKVRFKLHQIMMQTFYPNTIKDYQSVDHINKYRLDNNLSNLRFATRAEQYKNRENILYKNKKVKCLNNGKIYDSCQQAENELSLVKNTVSRAARGERKSIHGYKFIYV